MQSNNFECTGCGNCCINFEAYFSTVPESDVEMWKNAKREDILKWVSAIEIGDNEYIFDIWIDPKNGGDVDVCPWLRQDPKTKRYFCKIHDVKPKICRDYPFDMEHAKETGCKGF